MTAADLLNLYAKDGLTDALLKKQAPYEVDQAVIGHLYEMLGDQATVILKGDKIAFLMPLNKVLTSHPLLQIDAVDPKAKRRIAQKEIDRLGRDAGYRAWVYKPGYQVINFKKIMRCLRRLMSQDPTETIADNYLYAVMERFVGYQYECLQLIFDKLSEDVLITAEQSQHVAAVIISTSTRQDLFEIKQRPSKLLLERFSKLVEWLGVDVFNIAAMTKLPLLSLSGQAFVLIDRTFKLLDKLGEQPVDIVNQLVSSINHWQSQGSQRELMGVIKLHDIKWLSVASHIVCLGHCLFDKPVTDMVQCVMSASLNDIYALHKSLKFLYEARTSLECLSTGDRQAVWLFIQELRRYTTNYPGAADRWYKMVSRHSQSVTHAEFLAACTKREGVFKQIPRLESRLSVDEGMGSSPDSSNPSSPM